MTSRMLCPCGSGLPREDCDPGELVFCRAKGLPPHFLHRHSGAQRYCAAHDRNYRRRMGDHAPARRQREAERIEAFQRERGVLPATATTGVQKPRLT